MPKLTSKEFHFALRNKWTYERFCQYYNLTEESYDIAVKKVYRDKKARADVTSELKRNSANAAKTRKNTSPAPIDTATAVDTAPAAATVPVVEYEPAAADTAIESATAVDAAAAPSLEELKDYLEYISAELCSDEKVREEILSRKRQIFSDLRTLRASLVQFKSELQTMQQNFESNISQLSIVAEELENVNSDIEYLKDEKGTTEARVKELEKVRIFVYSTGEIVAENYSAEIPQVNPDLFQKFSLDDRFENLTMKQLRQLVRLMVLVSELQDYELSIEDRTFEQIWNELRPRQASSSSEAN